MRLALLQTKQNELYDFIHTRKMRTEKEILELQKEMTGQTFRLAEQAAEEGADLIVTTEAVNYAGRPGQYGEDYQALIRSGQEELLTAFAGLAQEHGTYIVLGMYTADPEGKLGNCAVVLDPQGAVKERYQKIHLAGEEKEYLEAGSRFSVIETEYGRVGICICWDMQIPETARQLALNGADLVVCPTWGWEAIYGHSRAYENGIYAAAAMAVPYGMKIGGLRSPSEIISPKGEILARGSRVQPGIVCAELDPKKARPCRSFRLGERRDGLY